MTMPAMAPPERPDPELAPAPGVADSVPEGNRGGIDTVVGSSTPVQRDSTRELTQHELVEFTLLSAQKEQRPCRLDSKPHSSGSFCTASMQLPLSELAGNEQRVKSARIWEFALLPGVPHSSGVDMTICSLVANSAFTVLAWPQHGAVRTYAGTCTQRCGVLVAGATGFSGVLNKSIAEDGSRVTGIEVGAVA
jgi:hypothetical protein